MSGDGDEPIGIDGEHIIAAHTQAAQAANAAAASLPEFSTGGMLPKHGQAIQAARQQSCRTLYNAQSTAEHAAQTCREMQTTDTSSGTYIDNTPQPQYGGTYI